MAKPAIVRLILRSFAALGIALVALVAVLLVINVFDEDLSPEVVELLKPAPPPNVRDEDNGYYVLVGLDAPTGIDPRVFGRQQVDRIVKEDERLRKMTRAEKLKEAEKRMQEMQEAFSQIGRVKPEERDRMEIKPGDLKYLCAYRKPCLEEIKRNRAQIKRILDENRELLDRYRLLLRRPRLVATYVPREYFTQSSLTLAGSAAFFSFHRLWITHVAFEFADGNLQAAFSDLEHDIVLQRALLRDASSALSKLRTIGLESDVALLAEMVVAKPAVVRQFNHQIEAMLAPLTPDELSWTRLAKEDMTPGIRALLEDAPDSAFDWLLQPFFKRNATVNRLYAAHRLIHEWNEFSASQHEGMRQRIAQAEQELRSPYWTSPRNPLGKLYLAAQSFNPYVEYFERYYDFDGLRRLAALAVRLAPHAQADLPGLIEKSGAGVTDPYTGKPMKWDADRKQIYFEPRGKRALEQKPPVGGVQGRIGIRMAS